MMRILIFLLSATSLSAATVGWYEGCADPRCCRSSKGPSSCHVIDYPCSQSCSKPCPYTGEMFVCKKISRPSEMCIPGESLSSGFACYVVDVSCDLFQQENDPCMDPYCWDPELMAQKCGSLGEGE